MPSVLFSVPFVRGKARPRHGMGRTYTPRQTVRDEADIWAAYVGACGGEPLTAPEGAGVRVAVRLYRPLPKSAPRREEERAFTVKPDADNALKLVLDALNPGGGRAGAWKDDSQVVRAEVVKAPRVRYGEEKTVVTVEWED